MTSVVLVVLASVPALVFAVLVLRRNAAVLAPPAREDAPRVSIGELAAHRNTRVCIVGTARASTTVASLLRVRALWGRGGFSDVLVESTVADFVLEDETGKVEVRGAGATIELAEHDTPLSAGVRGRAESVLAAQTKLRPRDWRVTSASCASGARIAVIARVPADGDPIVLGAQYGKLTVTDESTPGVRIAHG